MQGRPAPKGRETRWRENLEVRASGVEMLEREVQHRLPQMLDEKRIRHAVSGLGIEHQLERLAGLLKLVRELERVGDVDVVVDRTVDQEQCAVEIRRGESRRAPFVA